MKYSNGNSYEGYFIMGKKIKVATTSSEWIKVSFVGLLL